MNEQQALPPNPANPDSYSSAAPQSTQASAVAPAVHHYAVHLPAFRNHNPSVWVLQVECQFGLAGIASELTKFRYEASVLRQEVAVQLAHVLSAPPATIPYGVLKAAALDRTTASERKRLQQLLSAEELGGRRPSQLLRHMQSLVGVRADVRCCTPEEIISSKAVTDRPDDLAICLQSACGRTGCPSR